MDFQLDLPPLSPLCPEADQAAVFGTVVDCSEKQKTLATRHTKRSVRCGRYGSSCGYVAFILIDAHLSEPFPAERRIVMHPCRTVMIVEDDVMLRHTVAQFLKDHGLEVTEAGSGDEALSKLHSDDNVDLLLTDILMPGEINGIALANDVLREWPDTHVVITSAMQVDPGRIPAKARFLPKPFFAADVSRLVEELCCAEQSSV